MRVSVCILLCLCMALTQAVPQGFPRGRRVGGGGGAGAAPGGGRPARFRGNSPAEAGVIAAKPEAASAPAASPAPAAAAPPRPSKPEKRGPSCGGQACADGFELFQGKCYKVISSSQALDFTTSQRMCQQDGAVLASDSNISVHNFLKGLLKSKLTEDIDSRFRRAFVGLMCQDSCDTPANWVYADGSKCEGNSFCDWSAADHQWNAVPTALHGASIAAVLDDATDTQYKNKLQPYPVDHELRFAVCQRSADSTDHLKPRDLAVNERLTSVELAWRRPTCDGDVRDYIFVLLGGSASYDTEIKCTKDKCVHELTPADCNDCIQPNVEYTFSIAPILANAQLGPAITVSKKIDLETCPNFETPFHTVSTCRGVSELIQDGSCEPQVTWSKGSMCDVVCETGYGFFNEPAPKYSCDQAGAWNPVGKAPECYEIVPVHSANLQFKITYKQPNIENLQHQFDGLVYKYNDIFCPYPEECGIGDLQIKSALDAQGQKLSEVIITIDTPVYNITDQTGFIDLVREAVLTVNQDNAFMTLIDYDNIELVLPSMSGTNNYKAEPMLCCHSCPEGHAYRLGHCVLCPAGGPCEGAVA